MSIKGEAESNATPPAHAFLNGPAASKSPAGEEFEGKRHWDVTFSGMSTRNDFAAEQDSDGKAVRVGSMDTRLGVLCAYAEKTS
jgi:hypothetical protein